MKDKNFLEEACEKYGDMVYRIALARTGSAADAEDIFQEVFLRLFKNEEKAADHLKPWLIKCTVNRCRSLALSPWRKRRADFFEMPEFESEEGDAWHAVQSLPVKYRMTVHLHYGEGFSVKEIAEAMGCAEGTVKSRLSRGRKMLAELLKGDNDV